MLKAHEVAQILRTSIRTLERWRAKGEGPPHSCNGRRVAYRAGAVLAWVRQETRGRKEPAPLETKHTCKPVTCCPYIKDSSRWHADLEYIDPRTGKPDRKRRVAPAGLTLEGAIAWGEGERLRIVTELARSVSTDTREESEEEQPKKKTTAPTLAELWPEFSAKYIAAQKHNTRVMYGCHWTRHIAEALGDVRADQIDLAAMNKLRDDLECKGMAISSQKKVIEKVRRMLTWAMRRTKIPFAEIPTIEWDKVKKRKLEIFSPEDLEHFVGSGAKDTYERVLALLLADAVLRIGETAGLMWEDIDFAEGTMEIRRNVCQGVLQDTPKGEEGTIPLTPRLAAALKKLWEQSDHAFVLGRGAVEYPSDRALGKRVLRMQRDADLRQHGPHRCRHSRLTHLAERGIKPYALQALARHASLKTTMSYYIHTDKRKLAREAVAEIAAMTGPPVPPAPSARFGNAAEAKRKKLRIALAA
nr:tyrosine-type recombinase/integrase [Nannocystis pusilla]